MPPDAAMPHIATVTLSPALDLTIRLPRLQPGEVNRTGPAELRPAGKGINVAVMLAVLGEPSLAAALLGEGDIPAFEAFLRPLGIASEFVPLPGRCRINVKLVETEAGQVTDINPGGPQASEEALRQLGARLAARAPDIVVLAGSLPPGLPVDAWAALMRVLSADGRKLLLDTSGPALEAALPAGPALLKPNRAELSALLGRPLPDRAALIEGARALRRQGVERVVVSDGGAGALFVLPDATLWARPSKVALTTTVGAGDAMVAGLTAALARGLDAEATARLATGCAAAAVSRDVGAAGGGVPLLSEIERLAAAAEVTPL
ncbi:1-phosphofructokinase family hexose kinase [Pseudoroseomonas wenyumeiae]|uniref:Phosphofructokinase n=1 Tax=Teichococcus wenyumeiae TaxID=2478470 RepID=A0A3A9JC67_9PROT|nr:1-phosphofructokinase family hexose kinase [Pseudoroseomonas wenyumeiae]RKK04907.1 1-phosphofructokinase family hexose kinase [Pseudoroseomonas wenyumeiae]RMI26138.1 1-phosphofructokinase family hexose kinase [Pseudoroseomonas wenyumeiae]